MVSMTGIRYLYSQCNDFKIELKAKSIEYIKEVLSKQDNQEITLCNDGVLDNDKDVSVSILCHIKIKHMFGFVSVDKIRMIYNCIFFDSYSRFENEPLEDKRAEDLAKVAFAIERWLNKNNK